MADFSPLTPDTQVMADFDPVQKVVMKQRVDKLEAVTQGCFEQQNTYAFFNAAGAPMYVVQEDSNCCQRICCKPAHAAELKFYRTHDGKSKGEQVYLADKPCKWPCCFAIFDCCQDEIHMYKGPEKGQLLGKVKTPCCGGWFSPKFSVEDKAGQETGEITGPTCCIGAFCDNSFVYHGKSGVDSHIKKEGVSNLQTAAKELATDADNFTCEFADSAMTAETKATLLAAMLLLDYQFFEDDGNFECNPCEKTCQIKFCDCYFGGLNIPCRCNCDCSDNGEGGAEGE